MKIKLDLNDLQIESFVTSEESMDAGGTVFGHSFYQGPGFCTQGGSPCEASTSVCGNPNYTKVAGGCQYGTAYNCPPDATAGGAASCQCLYPKTDINVCSTDTGCSSPNRC